MNSDQIQSAARTLAKLAGAALLSHGFTVDSGTQELIGLVIAGIGIWLSQKFHADDQPAPKPPSPPSAGLGVSIILALCIAAPFLPGCAALDQTGPYQGDKVLYDADLAITSSYQLTHAFVTWEYQNRETLKRWPEIKAAADEIRANAEQWFRTALALRNAYKAAPDAIKATALNQSIATIQDKVTTSAGFMAAHTLDAAITN